MAKKPARKQIVLRSMYSVLDALAQQIRSVYVDAHRSRESARKGISNWTPGPWWDGGMVRDTKRANIWKKAAVFFLDNELAVVPFVRFAVFDFSSRSVPRPTRLLSKAVLEQYRAMGREEKIETNFSVDFQIQKNALRMALAWYDDMAESGVIVESDPDKIKRGALLDDEAQMSALFRYCLADSEGIADLAEDYYALAMLQYIVSPSDYDRVWGDWIPEQFRTEASLICDRRSGRVYHA